MDDFRLFLQEQRVYQKQQATQMANLAEILAGLVTQNINNNTPNPSQPSSSSGIPSQPLQNPKGSINAISFHEDSLEHEVTDDDEEEFLKMLEEISMKDDVGFEESEGIIKLGDGNQEDMPRVTNLCIPTSNDLVISLPGMEDTFDSIPEKLSDPRPCMVNCKVGNEDLDGFMCDPRACTRDGRPAAVFHDRFGIPLFFKTDSIVEEESKPIVRLTAGFHQQEMYHRACNQLKIPSFKLESFSLGIEILWLANGCENIGVAMV
ncbi:hypothetical protein PIB30_088336, partial [Stylosanthes scabra]|nr:hypothetical protein [Stylosanthes scabra]